MSSKESIHNCDQKSSSIMYVYVCRLYNSSYRKLFEPQYYPNSVLLQIFDKYFGSFESRNPSEVCVVGFEPNIRHAENLTKIEKSYNKCGWKTIIHTVTGVDVKAGKAEFAIATAWYNNIASHLVSDKGMIQKLICSLI